MTQLTRRFLDTPPVELAALVDTLQATDPQVLAHAEAELTQLAGSAAFLARYVSERRYRWNHARAARKANTTRRQVRRALGYAVTPDVPI